MKYARTTRATIRKVTMVMLAWLCTCTVSHNALADEIRLNASAVVAKGQSVVRLRDVAELDGAYAKSLGDLTIHEIQSNAHNQNQTRQPVSVTIHDLRVALTGAQANLGRVAITGHSCTIRLGDADDRNDKKANNTNSSVDASVDNDAPGICVRDLESDTTLRGLIARVLADQWLKLPRKRVRIEFDERDTQELALDSRLFEFELIPPSSIDSARVAMVARIFQHDRFIRELRLVVSIHVQQKTLVSTRYIQRGEVVRPGDLEAIDHWLKPGPIAVASATADFVGREAMATISEGQVIRVGDFQLPVVIDKHDEVTLIVKKGSFVISMAGRALEAGRVGQVIKVRPHNRKNELVGRIETTGIITVLDKT